MDLFTNQHRAIAMVPSLAELSHDWTGSFSVQAIHES